MASKKHFTAAEAKQIGEALGINWSKFDKVIVATSERIAKALSEKFSL